MVLFSLAALLCAGDVAAEECGFAQRNFEQYLAWCPLNDGCASETRMRALVAQACGGAPSAPSNERSTAVSGDEAAEDADRARRAVEAEKDRVLVRRVQERLNALGYDAGPVDGIPGARTVAAVQSFQAASGISPDGQITSTLLERLDAGGKEGKSSEDALCTQISADHASYERDVSARLAEKIAALEEGVSDLRGLRNQLTSDYNWTIGDAGGARELVTYLALVTKTTTDLIQGLSGFASEAKAARRLIMGLSPEAAIKGVRTAGSLAGLYRDTVEKVAFDYVIDEASELNPALRGATTVYKLGENIAQVAAIGGDLVEARRDYQRALAGLEAQITAMVSRVLAAERQLVEQGASDLYEWWMDARKHCVRAGAVRLP